MTSHLTKHRIAEVDEIEVNLSDKKLIYVMSCKGRNSASEVARLLASKSCLSGRNILLWDKSGQTEKEAENASIETVLGLTAMQLKNGLSIISNKDDEQIFTSLSFKANIKKLIETYDQVYVCSDDKEGALGLMALSGADPSLVLIARLRKTRKMDIKKINSICSVETLLYD